MQFVIAGLGNPGGEYEHTRHNAGRLAVESFDGLYDCGGFQNDSATHSLISEGSVGAHAVTLVLPETFMNKSGTAVRKFVPSVNAAERLVVVYDDIDLPFGQLRISYGRGSGGHKGVESIIRAVKTKDFVRVRIGVAHTTPSGRLKKPLGEKRVHDFVLGEFTQKEKDALPSILKEAAHAMHAIVADGRVRAMNEFN